MYMCMYVCICIYVNEWLVWCTCVCARCMCVCLCMCVCMYVFVYMWMNESYGVCAYVHDVCAYPYVWVCVCMSLCICEWVTCMMYVYMCTVYAHILTYVLICTYLYDVCACARCMRISLRSKSFSACHRGNLTCNICRMRWGGGKGAGCFQALRINFGCRTKSINKINIMPNRSGV